MDKDTKNPESVKEDEAKQPDENQDKKVPEVLPTEDSTEPTSSGIETPKSTFSSAESLEAKIESMMKDFYREYHLSPIQVLAVSKFIKQSIADKDNKKVNRVREWFIYKLNKRRVISKLPLQRGCPNIIPGLRAHPWWDTSEFPWIKVFEDNFERIKKEVIELNFQNKLGFQPYRTPKWVLNKDTTESDGVGIESTSKGKWNIFYLFLHNMKYETNCSNLPFTVSLISEEGRGEDETLPKCALPRPYGHSMVSAMVSNTHIIKHYGPTNKKLRFHLPLLGVEGSSLTVAGEERELVAGKGYVFDDSFEHEARHNGPNTRLILIADFWHPDLSNEEIKFLSLIQNAQMRHEKQLAEEEEANGQKETSDNFFSVIKGAQGLIKDNSWWSLAEDEKGNSQKYLVRDD